MSFVFGFIHRFFEFPRSRARGKFETNVALEILHVYDRQLIVGRLCALSFRDLAFFFLFFFF